jgi:hypothetical protein
MVKKISYTRSTIYGRTQQHYKHRTLQTSQCTRFTISFKFIPSAKGIKKEKENRTSPSSKNPRPSACNHTGKPESFRASLVFLLLPLAALLLFFLSRFLYQRTCSTLFFSIEIEFIFKGQLKK